MPKLAVLGQPVAHSRSPAMHTAALEELGLAPEWTYEAIDVAPADFEELVRSLPGQGFAGVNVTVPHKLAALAVADQVSDAARETGAANVLSFRDGGIEAAQTDTNGILDALPEPVEGRRALVMGAGGSARAALWALRSAGADVHVWNRTAAKAERLAQEFGATALPAAECVERTADFDLILNATSVGMAEASAPGGQPPAQDGTADLKPLPLDADGLHASQVVVDLVYGTVETQLIATARARGATPVDGLDVLVHQGVAALRLWTGLEPPLETMRRAARGVAA